MRLVFLYVAKRQAPPEPKVPWDKNTKATNEFLSFLSTEGYYSLISKMVQQGIVDEAMIIIESVSGTGRFDLGDKVYGYVMPQIEYLKGLLREDDVIWCRGGWRTWFSFLTYAGKKGHWLINYAANSGREKWLFWDIVFNDLDSRTFVDRRGRFQFYFKKPMNQGLFFPQKIKREYDLCIGASHIHDKKGQWKSVKVAIAYKEIFGENLKCVMPGALHHGTKTNSILEDVQTHKLDIDFPGMVSRRELGKIFNKSRLFSHLGGGGQNDRGPLEAMCCGTPLALAAIDRHAPYASCDSKVCLTLDIEDPPDYIAKRMRKFLKTVATESNRQYVSDYSQKRAGLDTVIIPEMKRLFGFLSRYPKVNREALWEEYGVL